MTAVFSTTVREKRGENAWNIKTEYRAQINWLESI